MRVGIVILTLFALMAGSDGLSRAEASPGLYLGTDEFLELAFPGGHGEPDRIIVDSKLRARIEQVLGHSFGGLRIRYWSEQNTTAWILDEVGKTEPITIGVAVTDGAVSAVRVLEFRESRGWEVRYPFFTEQFTGAELEGDAELDRPIDGITGATLSVGAVEKVVRVALLLDRRLREPDGLTGS